MSERHRGLRIGSEDASRTILWIHGYTGSPDAFAPSAQRFAGELDALVVLPLLPGHGTREENLLSYDFDDFLSAARFHFKECLERGRPIALIGYSFGGYLSLLLASEREVDALVLALTPLRLNFPFRMPGIGQVLHLLPFWGKHLTSEDVALRAGTFYYPHLPGRSLSLITEGNRRVAKVLPKIRAPMLTIHKSDDPLASPESGEALIKESGSILRERKVCPRGRHTAFLGPYRNSDEDAVIDFLRRVFKKAPPT